MQPLPAKVKERLAQAVPAHQALLAAAQWREPGLAETIGLAQGILQEVFGFEEGRYMTADGHLQNDGQLCAMVEVTPLCTALEDQQAATAFAFAQRNKIEAVVLTNARQWRLFQLDFPSGKVSRFDLSFASMSGASPKDQQALFTLCREGWPHALPAAEPSDFFFGMLLGMVLS